MHKAVKDFAHEVKQMFPEYFDHVMIVSVGAANINGSLDEMFVGSWIEGVDLAPGEGIHHVGYFHTINIPVGYYDVVVCTELLEHDKYYKETMQKMLEVLRPGGLLLVTAAASLRAPHGTHTSNPGDSPHTLDYYKNVTEAMIREAFTPEEVFSKFEIRDIGEDIQFYGIKNA